MRLLELELQNIKAFKEVTIAFGPGVNGLLGRNGAGKTTIQQAIGYALFNHLSPAIKDFVREGNSRGTIRVRMRSARDSLTYDIYRTVGSGTQNYVFNCDDGYKVCEGTSDVLSFVEEHLGSLGSTDMKTIFRNAVGIDQGTFQAPFLLGPAIRKDYFGPLLGIEKYRRIDADLNETRSYAQGLVAQTQTQLERLQGQLAPLGDLKERHSNLRDAVKGLAVEISNSETQRDAYLAQLKDLNALQRSVQQTNDLQTEAQMERFRLQERIKSLEREMDSARGAARQVDLHEEAYHLFKEAGKLLEPIEEEIHAHQVLQRKLSQLQGEKGLLGKQIRERQSQLNSLEAVQSRFDELQTVKIQEETIRRRLDSSPSQETNIASLEEALVSLQMDLEGNVTERESVTSELQNLEKLENELAELLLLQKTHTDHQNALRLQENSEILRLRSLQEQLEPLIQARGDPSTHVRCPICEQEMDPDLLNSLTLRLENELETGSQKLGSLQKILASGSMEMDRLIATDHQLREELDCNRPHQTLGMLSLDFQRLKKEIVEKKHALEGFRSDQLARQSLQEDLASLRPCLEEFASVSRALAAKSQWEEDVEKLTLDFQKRELEVSQINEITVHTRKLEAKAVFLQSQKERSQTGYLQYVANEANAQKLASLETECKLQMQDLDQNGKKLSDLHDKRAKLALLYDPKTHTNLQESMSKLNEGLAGKEATLNVQMQNLEDTEKELTKLQSLDHRRVQVEEELGILKVKEERVVWMKGLMRQALPRITAALINSISKLANEFYCQLMGDHTRQLQWNSEFGIVLFVKGEERSFRQLSGGEQMAASLSVTMALLRRMSNVRFVFLDEPTGNLDVERRSQLATRLRTLKGLEQIFVISHDDTFEEYLDQVVRLEAGPEGSRVVMET